MMPMLAHFSAHVQQAAYTTLPPDRDEAPRRGSLYDLSFSALERVLVDAGLNAVHTRALWKALYRGGGLRPGELEKFSPPLRRWIEARIDGGNAPISETAEVVADIASSDGLTRKFLLRLDDGQTIETVVMGYAGRITACVSTQAGCAMGCVFCATGQMGFSRHLRARRDRRAGAACA